MTPGGPGQFPLLGLSGTEAVAGHRGIGKRQPLKSGPESRSPLPSGGASFSQTSIPFREQTPELTDAGVPWLPLTRSFQLPGPELGPPRSVGSEPGVPARSRKLARLPARVPPRPALLAARRARRAGRATWPFPGRAGRGGPEAELSALTRPGPLLPRSSPTPDLSERLESLDTPSFPGSPTGNVVEITVTIGPFAAHNRNSTGQYPPNQLGLIHSSPDFSRLPAQPQPQCRISWSRTTLPG